MKAFWWFKDNEIAGMARPGFNALQWFDLTFEEAVLMGWLGQFSSGAISLKKFQEHLVTYAPKLFKIYKIQDSEALERLKIFDNPIRFKTLLDGLIKKSKLFSHASLDNEFIHLQICDDRLNQEIAHLKKNKINTIVSLTEDHHSRDILANHFHLHHISIADMGAPTRSQVEQLSEVFKTAKNRQERIAVHCLAGIGRTSTMIMGAHLLMGHSLDELLQTIGQRNPSFGFIGPQAEFIKNLK